MKQSPPVRYLSGADLINDAIDASGMSSRKFATDVLAVDERTVRRWKSGEYLDGFDSTPRVICLAIIERPHLARLFARVNAADRQAAEARV